MTDTSPSVTLAAAPDLPDILAMIRALPAFHGDTAQVTKAQLHHAFFGPVPVATALIAKLNGTAIGYAGLIPTVVLHGGETRLDIHHLFVVQDHRGRGVGTALIKAIKHHANTLGVSRLSIGTDPDNATAIAAYRAMPDLEEINGFGPRFWVKSDR
jgi:GNAT superfamily N-acetyltransferase